ncbi:hypothetical protein AB0A71_05405 [Kitasatospora aureofaciens]|uniref:hypothetical protein n=1 Tax=Kitasatospora aureofaciens TaxID=1894 RepID=UPI0033CE00E8
MGDGTGAAPEPSVTGHAQAPARPRATAAATAAAAARQPSGDQAPAPAAKPAPDRTVPPRPAPPTFGPVQTNAPCPPLQAITYAGCRPIGPVITLGPTTPHG